MTAINLASIMDAIADKLATQFPRVYPYPSDAVATPCWVVAYPEDIDFDSTFGRGSDRATFPVYYVAGAKEQRNTRDEISAIIAGTDNIKELLDGDLDNAVSSSYVDSVRIVQIRIGDVEYMTAQFDLIIDS